MKIKEISKDLYMIKFEQTIPIYLRKIDEDMIRITQPVLNEGKKFKGEEYFGKGFPQEIIIFRKDIKEIWRFLGKLLTVENLE